MKYPIGTLENVLVKVRKFFIPVDFIVLEMEEDAEIPIILGRPFLATAGAIIDVKNGKLTLKVGEEEVEFNLSRITKYPSFTDSVHDIDCTDELIPKVFRAEHLKEPLETCLVHTTIIQDENLKVVEMAHALEATFPIIKYNRKQYEELGREVAVKADERKKKASILKSITKAKLIGGRSLAIEKKLQGRKVCKRKSKVEGTSYFPT